MRSSPTALAALAACALAFGAATAEAGCQKLAFLVNDYGKDGPTKDAKNLLDKHIADWTKERGIKNYTVGKKDVSCELFLDFIVFDEHTCTASAVICWPDGQGPKKAPAGASKSKAPG
jgi:hypothetical protein